MLVVVQQPFVLQHSQELIFIMADLLANAVLYTFNHLMTVMILRAWVYFGQLLCELCIVIWYSRVFFITLRWPWLSSWAASKFQLKISRWFFVEQFSWLVEITVLSQRYVCFAVHAVELELSPWLQYFIYYKAAVKAKQSAFAVVLHWSQIVVIAVCGLPITFDWWQCMQKNLAAQSGIHMGAECLRTVGDFFRLWSVLFSSVLWHILVTGIAMPLVLWCCWFGSRKGIWLLKNSVMECWHGYLSGVRCRFAYGPADAHCHSLSLA